ncbi:MAG: hypothetical protein VW405_05245, partial [Rhodospirillaceae bacterium]
MAEQTSTASTAAAGTDAVAAVEQQMAAQVETVAAWVDKLIEFAIQYGFQILGALVWVPSSKYFETRYAVNGAL